MAVNHTAAFAEHVAARRDVREARDATRVTWRRVSADTGGGWSGLGPGGALVFVRPRDPDAPTYRGDKRRFVWGVIEGSERSARGYATTVTQAKSKATALVVANGQTAADEAVNRPKEDKMARKTSTSKKSPKTDQARAQREAKAALATKKAKATPTPAETPEVASSPESAPESAVIKLDPPSAVERAEAATGKKPKIETAPLEDALLVALREQVRDAERVDAKSGTYFRIRRDKATLGYVTASGSGLRCEIALAADLVPKDIGVEIKPGSGKLPVIVRVTDQSEAVRAGALYALAAGATS